MGRLRHQREPDAPLEAGALLDIAALDYSGLLVRHDGTLVQIMHVSSPNLFVRDATDVGAVAAGFAQLLGRLSAGQSLQFYVQSRPVILDDVLARSRAEVTRWAGPPPTAGHRVADPRSRDRWRLYGAMEESLRMHSDRNAAVDLRTYVIVPWALSQRIDAKQLVREVTKVRLNPGAAPTRERIVHEREARRALAHADAVRAALDTTGATTRLLDGAEVMELLHSRFAPTASDRGVQPSPLGALTDLRLQQPKDEAIDRARTLRSAIAAAPIDFSESAEHARVDRDAERTIYVASTAESTRLGWLMGTMMSCVQPYVLSVHVHALDRRQERRRLKMSYRRTFAVNRYSEARGHLPDFDRYFAENEQEQLLTEMSGQERATVYRLSIYQAIRVRGPEPDLDALEEAVGEAAERMGEAVDARVDRGKYQQAELWRSTLPLGSDPARRWRKYASRNVVDSTPLLGVAVGSPTGIPFAYTVPGRTLENFNPYDPSHPNHLCLVTGRSGAGKTMLCNILMARFLAHGARGFVIDRAGHYGVLTNLIDGAQHIDIGEADADVALNPWDVDDPETVTREKIAFLIGLHETMFEEGLTTLERSQLGAAIRSVYEWAAISGELPRESMLKAELERRAEADAAKAPELASNLRNLAERLAEYCGAGAYAHVADTPSTFLADSPLLVFDTRRCPPAVLKPVIFTVLEFITRSVERHRREHRELASRPDAPLFAGRSVMLGDEFWSVVSNPALGSYANDLARRSRHLGLTMLVATQQLSDFDNEHGIGLLRNSTIQIFLAQHNQELEYVREAIGLSQSEFELIAGLTTVKRAYSQAYWINGTRGRGKVSLRVGPTEYWAFTSDPVRDTPLRDERIAAHGGDVWKAIGDLAGELRA